MRRTAPVGAALVRRGADAATFVALQLPLMRLVFLALPPDARGRACCVCRAWRDALAEPALWTRLDMCLVPVDGQRFLAVLRGAARCWPRARVALPAKAVAGASDAGRPAAGAGRQRRQSASFTCLMCTKTTASTHGPDR